MLERDDVLSPRVVLTLATHGQQSVFLVLFCGFTAFAQEPVIDPQGVVNAASFAGAGIASGGIASLFGRNLAPAARSAEATPLPRSLEGTSVTVGGIAAPLFYVSPTQINFQVPTLPFLVAEQVPVVVSTAVGTSAPVLVDLVFKNIGIFTQDARGCGPGAVQNVAADGSVTLNTPSESASPGNFVSVYATGLGPVSFAPPDGEPASSDPLSPTWSGAGVRLGPDGFARLVLSGGFSGRAPGLVGVDQVNFQIPDDAPEGCAVALWLTGGPHPSQPVTISIRRGGGQCQDAPPARFASLRWQKIVTTGPDPSANDTKETFVASFSEAPENQVAEPLPSHSEQGCSCGPGDFVPGSRCPGTGLRALDAGPLTLQGLGLPGGGAVTVTPSSSSGELEYRATLPAGSLQGQPVRVTGAGGPDIGAFQTALSLPEAIEVTTPLLPGTLIPSTEPFRVTWTKGSPDRVVRVRLVSRDPLGNDSSCECAAAESEGEVTFPVWYPFDEERPTLIVHPGENVRAEITVSPRAGQVQTTFSAPRLTREGTHEWSYEYRFMGLKIRNPEVQ